MPELGPLEVRRATGAFNRMRARIRREVEERTRMLAAISHDLRTPLARLRLRVDGLRDSRERADIRRDLERMEALLGSALAFLRGQEMDEPIEEVDLPSLLESVCDRYAELGHEVAYQGPDHLVVACRPQALDRAVANLVANAATFGEHVVVRLATAGDLVAIEVEDDGPGIRAGEKEQVLEPFYRGDAERDPARAGFGLGLTIVASLVAAHGGRLEFADRAPHGLRARILLPTRGPDSA